MYGIMQIKAIDKSIKPILEEFLSSESYQEFFKEQAKALGYKGDDPNMTRVALFTPDDDANICFANHEVYEAFVDFQILKQLRLIEPYGTFLRDYPQIEKDLIKLGKRIMAGEVIQPDEVLALIPSEPTE